MSRSPFFDGWKSCPRCTADLDIVDARATCPECELVVYANPGPTVSGVVLDDDGRILLARRAADPGRGLWDILGGFNSAGDALSTWGRRSSLTKIRKRGLTLRSYARSRISS